LYGVAPEPQPEPDEDNHLLRGLAHTPMRQEELDDPGFLLPDWVVTRPRLTGICGSDAKQVFMDWVNVATPDNPMKGFFSLPQVLGHEVVADVVALGPEAEGLEVGDRVVLNPWLSCRPRGVDPICPACEAGDLSLCWNFSVGPIAPGIHTGTSKDAGGGDAQLMPAHHTQLVKVPPEGPATHPGPSRAAGGGYAQLRPAHAPQLSKAPGGVPDELAVFAAPFAVSLHSVPRHPPVPGGKVMVYGSGALGTCATAIIRSLH